jgi:hypothetical protein
MTRPDIVSRGTGALVCLFFLTLLTPVYISAQSLPATLGWYEMPNTKLRPHCPTEPSIYGVQGCKAVTIAWNSAVFDTRRNRLVIWGGGHNDYYGNELYALNLTTLSTQRLTNPGLPPAPKDTCVESIADSAQPNSRHTYDGIVYMPNIDRMFVFGGSLACGPGYFSRGTWTFDFSTLTWHRMDPSGTVPSPQPGIVSAYDPNTGKVFLHDNEHFYSYSFNTNAFTRLATWNQIGYHSTAVIDPVRKTFVIVGYDSNLKAGRVRVYDISGTSYSMQTLDTTGGDAVVNAVYPGLAYDPITGQIVAWRDGNSVYTLNLDKKVWTQITYPGGPSCVRAGEGYETGTYGRWAYSLASSVFVVVNSVDSNAFAFKLSLDKTAQTPPVPPERLRVE